METIIKETANVKVTVEISPYMIESEIKKIVRIREYYDGELESDIALKEKEFKKIYETLINS